ncbi:MAG TPA: SNF2 helicase-associated domain-containing protein [Acidimicrobiales bacterium]
MLRLADAGGGPIGSPWLEDEPTGSPPEPSGSPQSLLWWMATGLILEWRDVWLVLSRMSTAAGDQADRSTSDPSSIILAADFRFATRAAEMALELATRGRIVPSLEPTADGWRARWRPLIDGYDRGRIEALLWSLPASFLAAGPVSGVQGYGPGEPEPGTPDEVLRALMWSLTDAMGRQFATGGAASPQRRRSRAQGAVDAWLAALVSPEGIVEADDDELAALAEKLHTWQATASLPVESVRTCFRIVPPGDEAADLPEVGEGAPERVEKRSPKGQPESSDTWRIEFLLQAVDDPSLLVPAAAVWTDGPELTALERHVSHPDESLLRGLGRAARLVPSLGPALAEMAPCDQTTDATGILTFLRDGGPVLEEAGFGVLAPPWWRSSRARLALRLRARTGSKVAASTGTIGLEGLCDIRWEAVLGDDKLGLAELRQLARLKQPLVRLRGQWVELHEEDLVTAITAVTKRGTSAERISAGEVVRIALGLGQATGGLPVTEVEADGWLGTFSPVPTTNAYGRFRHLTALPGSCVPTKSAALAGSRSSATSVSELVSLTTWGWGRLPSSSPCWLRSTTVG